jgi:hypothetical protein
MRQISIIAIILALFATWPPYAVPAQGTPCASGEICPWQSETPHHAAAHAAGHFDLTCASGSVPCCRYQAVRTRDHAMVLVASLPVFKQAPAAAGGLDLPDRRLPAGASYILRIVSKDIPLYLKTLTLLC